MSNQPTTVGERITYDFMIERYRTSGQTKFYWWELRNATCNPADWAKKKHHRYISAKCMNGALKNLQLKKLIRKESEPDNAKSERYVLESIVTPQTGEYAQIRKQARDNYQKWLKLVGLDPASLKKIDLEKEFPSFNSFTNSLLFSKLDPFHFRLDQIQRIKNEIKRFGSSQGIRVEFLPGMGCTTAFKYIVHELKESSDESDLIVVDLDLKELAEKEADSFKNNRFGDYELEKYLRKGILETIVSEKWENISNQPLFWGLLGFTGRSEEFAAYQEKIREQAKADLPLGETGHIPLMELPLSDIIRKTFEKHRITTVLMADISSKTPVEHLDQFSAAVKVLKDKMGELPPAALRECYFITRDLENQWDSLLGVTPGTATSIVWEDYSPSEIFVILQKQYSFRITTDTYESKVKGPVLEGDTVKLAKLRARKRDYNAGLKEIAEELKGALEETMAMEVKVSAKLTAAQEKELENLMKG